jgi:hypothetical protein
MCLPLCDSILGAGGIANLEISHVPTDAPVCAEDK